MGNVIIEHEDGRRYSTTQKGFTALYEDQGFKIVGEESPSDFAVVGVPAPKRSRSKPRAKGAKGAAATPLASGNELEAPKPSEVISPPQVEEDGA